MADDVLRTRRMRRADVSFLCARSVFSVSAAVRWYLLFVNSKVFGNNQQAADSLITLSFTSSIERSQIDD